MLDSYGKIYKLNNNIKGKWIKNVINNISNLYINFIEETEEYPNGIKADIKYRGFKNRIGEELSIFLVNCYIIKRIKKSNLNEEVFIYLTPVNVILNSINNKSNYLKEMESIFNHPHFKGSNNIEKIINKTKDIVNLNNR